MAGQVKADCGANLMDQSYALNDLRFILVSSGTLKPERRHSFPLRGRRAQLRVSIGQSVELGFYATQLAYAGDQGFTVAVKASAPPYGLPFALPLPLLQNPLHSVAYARCHRRRGADAYQCCRPRLGWRGCRALRTRRAL